MKAPWINLICMKKKLRSIFDQWLKFYFGLDLHPEIQILKGLYSTLTLDRKVKKILASEKTCKAGKKLLKTTKESKSTRTALKIFEWIVGMPSVTKTKHSHIWQETWIEVGYLATLKSLNSQINVLHDFDVEKSVSNSQNLLAGSTAVLLETLF